MGITRIEDQASGLRKLFNPHGGSALWPVLHALVCPGRPALSLPLGQALAHAWADEGHCLAWVDEIDAPQRERWPWPCRVRYDLAQAMAGHVPLAAATQQLDERLWFAAARRLDRLSTDRGWPVARRLAESGVAFDAAFISVDPASARLWSHYGAALHYTVVVGASQSDLQSAFDWMTRVPAAGVRSWRLLPVGPQGMPRPQLQGLIDSGAALLGQPLELIGPVQASWQGGELSALIPAVDALARAVLERLLQD